MREHACPPVPRPAVGGTTVASLKRLGPYLRPRRRELRTVSALAALAALLALAMPQVLKWIVDGPVAQHDPRGVALGGLALLLLGGAEAWLFGLRRRLVATSLADIEARMRADFHRHAQRLPIAAHDGWTSGQLLSRGTSDPQTIHLFVAGPLTFLPVHAATLAAGAAILFAQQWLLALVVLAPVPLLVAGSYRFESRYAHATRRAQDLTGDLTTAVLESVAGIRVIKGFRRSEQRIARFRDRSRQVQDAELDKARLLGGFSAVTTVLPGLATAAALATGAVQVADGHLSIGSLLAFLGTVAALRPAVEGAGGLLAGCHDAAAAANRYFEVLDQPTTDDPGMHPSPRMRPGEQGPTKSASARSLAEPASTRSAPAEFASASSAPAELASTASAPAEPASTTSALAELASTRSAPAGPASTTSAPAEPTSTASAPAELAFAGVGFRYPGAPAGGPHALRDVTLRVAPGETLAVVGATGSGKTTLASLAARLYDPSAGRITLDGVHLARLPGAVLRSMVAVAFAEPVLFSGTVMDNVLMGAVADAGQVDRALRSAGAEEFVRALADGARTRVGEGGMSLSGGQRQRIALARIMLRRPRVAVLDDPLSALDVRTEAQVQDALREVLASTTALVVAHRLSTVLMADRVALLAGGRVAAVGTHTELLATCPAYAALMTPVEAVAGRPEGV